MSRFLAVLTMALMGASWLLGLAGLFFCAGYVLYEHRAKVQSGFTPAPHLGAAAVGCFAAALALAAVVIAIEWWRSRCRNGKR